MTEDEFIQTDQREREMQNQLTITMEPEENNEECRKEKDVSLITAVYFFRC